MRIPKFIKSKGFKIYVVIGLLVYIVPYFFGLTNAVRIYLEQKTIFSDYIDEIKHIYINNDKDIAMCVKGNTSGQFGVEYWAHIPYSHYEYSERNFGKGLTDISKVPHGLIERSNCSKMPFDFNEYSIWRIDVVYDKNLEKIDNLTTKEILGAFSSNEEDTLYVFQSNDLDNPRSQIWLARTVEQDVRIGTLFFMETLNHRSQLNPLWKLLYIPAFILDVLLWPMYLLLFLYTAFIAQPPR